MNTFIGVDLGWYGKPSGLASLVLEKEVLRLRQMARLESVDEILKWIQGEAGNGSSVVAVDAPLVIPNQTGIRGAERALNRDFRRFHRLLPCLDPARCAFEAAEYLHFHARLDRCRRRRPDP